MACMDRVQAAALRELLAAVGARRDWLDASVQFASALRRAPGRPGGLLLTGPADAEPWHFAAHLTDEARWAGVPELSPVLVRHAPPPGAAAHLAVGLERLGATGRGEALLVVSARDPADFLLERVDDARRRGARVLALEEGAAQLRGLAHESLTVPVGPGPLDFDSAQHLVSFAASARGGPGRLRAAVRRWADAVNGPAVERW